MGWRWGRRCCGLAGDTPARKRVARYCGGRPCPAPHANNVAFAGPWETVGFGIMGAYGLNKLDEFEKSSRVKYDKELKRKLERNRVRAHADLRRCMQPRVAPPRDR